MKISLQQINESYQALIRLASKEFPKEHHKLSYKLSRVVKSAKCEIEALGEALDSLMRKHGIEPGAADADPDAVKEYSKTAKAFMKETDCHIWGDPFLVNEIIPHVSISAFDLALLDWLIVEEEETPQAAAATS